MVSGSVSSSAMPIDASNRPNDRSGYSVYAGVLFASAEQIKAVDGLRAHVRAKRAALHAHVTVMGTFCDVKSLDAVKQSFTNAIKGHGPAKVTFDGAGMKLHSTWAGYDAVKSPELVRLHKSLVAAVGPLVTDAYGYAEHGYAPHLTLWQECPPENQQIAEKLGRELRLGEGFTADSVALVGRAGTAYGGKWVTVQTFPLRA